jgi:hypothetical protein
MDGSKYMEMYLDNLFYQLRYKHISVNFTLLLSKYSTAMQKDILNFK